MFPIRKEEFRKLGLDPFGENGDFVGIATPVGDILLDVGFIRDSNAFPISSFADADVDGVIA